MKYLLAAVTAWLALSGSAYAAPNFKQYERWQSETVGDSYTVDGFDRVLAETPTHLVVYQNGGTACEVGFIWLFNKENKSYRPVDPGTCQLSQFKVQLTARQLIFKSGNTITALYPL